MHPLAFLLLLVVVAALTWLAVMTPTMEPPR